MDVERIPRKCSCLTSKHAHHWPISIARRDTFTITSNANAIKHPYLKEISRADGSSHGDIRVYRKAEADTVTKSKPQIGQFKLELETSMALLYLADELLEDSPQMDAFCRREVPTAISFALEDEMFRANGIGRCLGILNSPALITVPKEAGQTAATIVRRTSKTCSHACPW